nr:flocculation protein FLO11-like [Leptinotarsa decemlineata]
MKLMLWLLALSGYIITVRCSLSTIVANPGGIGGIYRGPNSETVIKGPDGSLITSQETGGSIQTNSKLEPIIVAESEIASPIAPEIVPDVSPVPLAPLSSPDVPIATLIPPLEPVISATVAPITASVSPVIASVNPVVEPHVVEIIEQDPHIIETEIVDAPDVEPELSSDLVGPSGSISTRGSSSVVSGPASTTISKPARVVIAAPVLPIVPVISSVTTHLHSTPYVEVNNEIPLKSISRATVAADVSLVLSTIAPIGISTVSTLAPPIIRDVSNVETGLRNTGINIVSTLLPPIIRDTPPITGNIGVNVVSTLAPPPSDLGNIRGYAGSSSVSSTVRDFRPVVSSTSRPPEFWNPDIYEQVKLQVPTPLPVSRFSTAHNRVLATPASPNSFSEDSNIVQPASSYGFIDNSARSDQDSSTFSPGVIYSSTVGPPPIVTHDTPVSSENIQGLDENLQNTKQIINTNVGANLQPGSSNEFIRNSPFSGEISPTPSPRVIYSSEFPPGSSFGNDVALPDGNIHRLEEAVVSNGQFFIDPTNIPSRNIIPPEIGRLPPVSNGATDLGTTVQVSSVPRAPELLSPESPNVQRIDNAGNGAAYNYRNIPDRSEENLQNEIILSDSGRDLSNEVYQLPVGFTSNVPLLRNTNPIVDSRDFRRQFAQVQSPLAPDSGYPLRPGDYDDSGSVNLWNRYGRTAQHKNQ